MKAPRQPGRRPLVRRIALGAVLGAVTMWAIAWALAAWRPIPMYPRTTIGAFERWGLPWHRAGVDRVGITDLWWLDLRADTPGGETDALVRDLRASNAEHAASTKGIRLLDRSPGWGTFARSGPPPAAYASGSDTAFGWPLPCLWYQVLGVNSKDAQGTPTIDQERMIGGILVNGEPSCVMRKFHALPLLPRWPALLVDGGFFATLWWIVLLAPGAVRRRARRRRGRCVGCGYDLSATPPASPCPECGAVLKTGSAGALNRYATGAELGCSIRSSPSGTSPTPHSTGTIEP